MGSYQLWSSYIWNGSAAALVLILVILTALHRDPPRECSHRREVPVRTLEVFGGQHVADWCPDCGRTAYMLPWIREGK